MSQKNSVQPKKILMIMTGSIACFKACGIISKLVQLGHQVQVVASPSALHFVGAATIEGLSGNKVHGDLWESGTMMSHIHLVRWADLILVAPATANYVNRIANGVGDDLTTTLFLAHDFKKPFLIAPAMNTSMYLHPVTQKSVNYLKSLGIKMLETASGVLACGEVGLGKLLEIDEIAREVQKELAQENQTVVQASTRAQSASKLPATKVFVTGGGTRVPIDSVRSLTNVSTGETAAILVDHLYALGFEVTFLRSRSAIKQNSDINVTEFDDFKEFEDNFKKCLKSEKPAIVIHLAAVSDFVLGKSNKGKMDSSKDVVLRLKKTPKLVNLVKKISPKSTLVAFKLTDFKKKADRLSAVQKLFQTSHADLIVQNDMSEILSGNHRFSIFQAGHGASVPAASKSELASILSQMTLELIAKKKDERLTL